MTRKYIEALAAALRAARSDVSEKEPAESHGDMLDGTSLAAEHVADAIAALKGPGFDKVRFLRDCGVTP